MEAQSTNSEDGTEIAWYDFGGNGPDLLLGHATGFLGRIWEPVVEHLTSDFRCIAYDVRGHGLSEAPQYGSEAWDWERYADDVVAVLDASGAQHPFGVGHSSGGATELLVEERNPGTFRALYLFEPVIFTQEPPTGPDPDRDLAVRTRKRRVVFESRDDAIENFSARGPFATLDPAALDAYVDYGFKPAEEGKGIALRCDPGDEAEVYVMASAHDGFTRLPTVKCPVVIAHGAASQAFTEEHMRTLAERLPHGEFIQWPGMGHFGPLEQPKAFATAIAGWFRGNG